MSGVLYTTDILRLATSIPHLGRFTDADAHVERRSPVCGSRVCVDVRIDVDGRVAAFAQTVNACALGQAAAALLGAHVIGRSLAELEAATAALTAYLSGGRDDPGAWPGLLVFEAARPHSARHPSIRLPFEAATAAITEALQARRHAA
jgi:NifU-like protein involved in Fe-S cluster formation